VAKAEALSSRARSKATLVKACLIPDGESDQGYELGASGNGLSARLASLRTISI